MEPLVRHTDQLCLRLPELGDIHLPLVNDNHRLLQYRKIVDMLSHRHFDNFIQH